MRSRAPTPVRSWRARRRHLTRLTEYAPGWVRWAWAFALGLGTMIGWKPIVVTVGGRSARGDELRAGDVAQLVTAGTILAADGPARRQHHAHPQLGRAAAWRGRLGPGRRPRSGTIALAWVLTLPPAVPGASFYLISRAFVAVADAP